MEQDELPFQTEEQYLLEVAWGIIANAGWDEWSGDVNQEKTTGWLNATLSWRKDYFDYLDRTLHGRD